MRIVYLVCGVSGSGKTWVCEQVADKFHYVPHDMYPLSLATECAYRADLYRDKAIITECPFAERVLRDTFIQRQFIVHPYFVIEAPNTCAERYLKREGKPIQKAALTRASTIVDRAIEWGAPYGTAEEILEMLRAVKV